MDAKEIERRISRVKDEIQKEVTDRLPRKVGVVASRMEEFTNGNVRNDRTVIRRMQNTLLLPLDAIILCVQYRVKHHLGKLQYPILCLTQLFTMKAVLSIRIQLSQNVCGVWHGLRCMHYQV